MILLSNLFFMQIGYLYLTNTKRLQEVMLKLGFVADGPPT